MKLLQTDIYPSWATFTAKMVNGINNWMYDMLHCKSKCHNKLKYYMTYINWHTSFSGLWNKLFCNQWCKETGSLYTIWNKYIWGSSAVGQKHTHRYIFRKKFSKLQWKFSDFVTKYIPVGPKAQENDLGTKYHLIC